jgi:acyl-CoA reductase-like NAD-dependent aldehyde dehydrogenase
VRYGVQDVMINSGQTCTALTRMLLPASRYAEALELALAETLSLRMGDPLDPQLPRPDVFGGAAAHREITSASAVRRRAAAVRW